MALNGADVSELRAAATQISKGASALQSTVKALHSLINGGAGWRGPDAERFRAEWSNVSTRTITTAVSSLQHAADELRRNADQQDQASGAGTGGSPPTAHGARQLLEHLENDEKDAQGVSLCDADGLRIERVKGPDGETRLIVYFKGQDTTIERDFGRSAGLASGAIGVDESLMRQIDEALKQCPQGVNTDVMLVGLSQGGMDAQNVAAAGRYHVTNLVTYGSPIIQPDNQGIDTVHLQADGDPVPGMGAGRGVVAALGNVADGKYIPGIGLGSFFVDAASPPSSDYVFKADPGLGMGMQVHENGYPDVAKDFDTSADPRFADVKASMKKFEGTVIDATE